MAPLHSMVSWPPCTADPCGRTRPCRRRRAALLWLSAKLVAFSALRLPQQASLLCRPASPWNWVVPETLPLRLLLTLRQWAHRCRSPLPAAVAAATAATRNIAAADGGRVGAMPAPQQSAVSNAAAMATGSSGGSGENRRRGRGGRGGQASGQGVSKTRSAAPAGPTH